jgi:hypothetical protein
MEFFVMPGLAVQLPLEKLEAPKYYCVPELESVALETLTPTLVLLLGSSFMTITLILPSMQLTACPMKRELVEVTATMLSPRRTTVLLGFLVSFSELRCKQ